MTPDQILEIDAKRNHPPGTQAGNLRALINRTTERGGGVLQQGNTLVTFRLVKPNTVMFHTYNADTPQNLVKNVEMVFQVLKKLNVKMAMTTYTNPKINDLFKLHSKNYKVEIDQVREGFVAKVRLL